MVRNDAGSLQGTVENGNGATLFLIAKAVIAETLDYFWVSCKPSEAFEFQTLGRAIITWSLSTMQGHWRHPPPDVPDSIIPIATSVRIDAGAASPPVIVKRNAWSW